MEPITPTVVAIPIAKAVGGAVVRDAAGTAISVFGPESQLAPAGLFREKDIPDLPTGSIPQQAVLAASSTSPGIALLNQVQGVRIDQNWNDIPQISSLPFSTKYRIATATFAEGPKVPGVPGTTFLYLYQAGLGVSQGVTPLEYKEPTEYFMCDFFSNQPRIRVERPAKVVGKSVRVYDSQGILLGKVKKDTKILSRKLKVQGPSGAVVYHIRAPKVPGWAKLSVSDANKVKVGYIMKRNPGDLEKTVSPTAQQEAAIKGVSPIGNTYEVVFPVTADLTARILLIAAAVMTDFVWFEEKAQESTRHA